MQQLLTLILLVLLSGCASGAVMFEPTPLPPDRSPRRYEHPGGAFALVIPPDWAIYEQNTTTLAAATFSPPGAAEPLLTVAAVYLGETLDGAAFSDALDRYQAAIRPDAARYKAINRQAMGDGSWRLDGLRDAPGGQTEQINTFIEQHDGLLLVADAVLPANPARQAQLQTIINTLEPGAAITLQAADLSVLSAVSRSAVDIVRVTTWTTPDGVFYLTGEIANRGSQTIAPVMVHAALLTVDDLPAAEALDTTMGYGIAPGDYAPFSLRFGQGQPALSVAYTLTAVDAGPLAGDLLTGPVDLGWIDESRLEDGRLFISGVVTNNTDEIVTALRVIATVFDERGQVIGARFEDVPDVRLGHNQSRPFEIVVPEIGGDPAQYIITIQGRPE